MQAGGLAVCSECKVAQLLVYGVSAQAGGLAVCSLCKIAQLLVYGVFKCKRVVLQCVHCARVHHCWFVMCLSASRWSCSVLWVSVNSNVFVQAVGLAGYLSAHVFQVSWRSVMSLECKWLGL